jgi:hypothetical protein
MAYAVLRFLMIGSLLLVASAADAQQPATLTFACKGTTTWGGQESPYKMSVILNFTDRTVQGFGTPGLLDYPVRITGANDVMIVFGGSQEMAGSVASTQGSIDRVTGDLEAATTLTDQKTSKTYSTTTYSLQCKPAQRMF